MTSIDVQREDSNRPVDRGGATRGVPFAAAVTALLSLVALVSACEAPSPGTFEGAPTRGTHAAEDAGSVASVESAAIADVTSETYRASPGFVHVTSVRYASAAAAGSTIDVWASANAAAEYARISPDVLGSGASLPRGALIVREVHDASGALHAVTAMFKGEEGYNPALGDWGFIDIPSPGATTLDAGMTEGPTPSCFSCHLPRVGDDFLFGVPRTAR